MKHWIKLGRIDTLLIHPPYRTGPMEREFEKEEINQMFSVNSSEPSQIDWASPIVFIEKKYRTPCFCVVYHKLNAVTIRNLYPIARLPECIYSLVYRTIYRHWALLKFINKLILSIRNEKHAFTSCHGLFRFIRTPFGLEVAPERFPQKMDVLSTKVEQKFVLN